MPTNKPTDEQALSRLLSQAEPPRSPEHVDDFVLKYARENVPAAERASPLGWLIERRWIPAVATLSVAAIAVSVSLQIFTPTELEQDSMVGVSDLAVSAPQERVSLEAAAPDEQNPNPVTADAIEQVVGIAEERVNRARADADVAQNAQPGVVAITAPPADPEVAELAAPPDRPEVAELSASQGQPGRIANQPEVTSLAAPITERQLVPFTSLQDVEIQQQAAAQPAAPADANTQQDVALPQLAIQSNARRAVASTAPTGQAVAALNIATESVAALSAENLPAFFALMIQVLDEAEQDARLEASAVEQKEVRAQRLVSLYTTLVDEGALAAAEARYLSVTADFADFALPETLAAAINLLQTLGN
ncbi:MAG: hypothetical protein O2971_06070 [Proteobacteria bacterium]|nr:hypothetical protein [Pseudomonadota bacterium]